MMILFVNAHKKNEEGNFLFKTYYQAIHKVCTQTIFYGNEITEIIRSNNELNDYIYDEVSFRLQEKARQKFQSLEYIFVDGCSQFAPWSQHFQDVTLLIKISLRQGKKIHLNGFGHFASYFCLTTKFDKFYVITTEKNAKNHQQIDYFYDEKDGSLLVKNKKICNSGVKIISSINRPFTQKSCHAVEHGVVLPTKFHYVVFDSKSGSKITKNIETPFTFYWKGKIFCTSKVISQVKADILYETQHGEPLAFAHGNALSTQGLCTQFLKLIKNWIDLNSYGKIDSSSSSVRQLYKNLAIENKLEFKRSSSASKAVNLQKTKLRPQSSKFSSLEFEKPSIRCSGNYQTIQERYSHQALKQSKFNLGRSKMNFKGTLEEHEIKNYVERSPSRPSSSHKYRTISKQKWVSKNDFINC